MKNIHNMGWSVGYSANLCPIAFGEVVFKARTLYSLLESNTQYDDLSACNAIGIQIRKGKPTSTLTNSIKLFPNPTSDEATILFDVVPVVNTILRLTNVFGQVVYEKTIGNSLAYKINTQSLPTGVYHISVSVEDRNIFNENLIIIKN